MSDPRKRELLTVTLSKKTWMEILHKLGKASIEVSWDGRVISSDHTLETQLYLAMLKGETREVKA